MAIAQTNAPTLKKPLRLWPGVVLVILQWLVRLVVPVVEPEAAGLVIFVDLGIWLAVIVWWVFFSRAPWSERLGAVVLMIAAVFATLRIPGVLHESIAKGAMGFLFIVLVVPVLSLALVAWAVASRRLPDGPRRAAMAASILLACGVFTLLRTGGISGAGDSDLHWRWTETPEERLLAQAGDEPVAIPGDVAAPAAAKTPEERPLPQAGGEPAAVPGDVAAPATAETPEEPFGAQTDGKPVAVPGNAAAPAATETGADWPGFRGPQRDGISRGARIETDWSASPPVELWRRPIGPGWSSFAVHGDLLFTQEQRGDEEVVACYNLITGAPVWRHSDAARFWESNAGAGPRATPTLSNGRVYTLGATGILNALDARDGSVVWSRNAATDTGAKLPGWGFSGSPLVVGDVVIAATAGTLAAYDVATGDPRWKGPAGGSGYSSPHLVTIDGVAQILLLNTAGAISVAPADGKLLWEHRWQGDGIVQPALTADGDVLIGTGSGMSGGSGVRRIAVAHGPGGWTVEERWTSIGLKPYFNDFVVHEGHAFGVDGSMLASIDLADGKRKWKGGRYGHGQLVLLPDQDLLLVLSEKGELALVRAAPDQFTELARFPAIEGKTWNHPVLAGDVLLVRNDQEMAAFRLPLAGRNLKK
ncbi:MAG TPA: PQQ-binding-like beta-propeller repeat protein [Thermoanaerobaculia bacterium]|nr:PQQ-binding-like beta-propeller repeat protein [Thermoanaerobaculia bacterium]